MSETTAPSTNSSWQASLVSLEAEALHVWRSNEEQVTEVQAKRQEARGAAARLAEAQRRLVARQGRGVEDDKLVTLRGAVQEAEVAQRQAVADYEQALSAFHKKRGRLHNERELVARRREALMNALPDAARQAYGTLVASGMPDPVAIVREGRCTACGHDTSTDLSDDPIVCPFCKRLIVRATS